MTLPSDSTIVREALAEHYRAHGLPTDGGAADPWFRVRIGAISVRLPNPPARRRAVFFHDVNHLATGYNTTFSAGEMVIAGFEVGAGCGDLGIVWFINLNMMALGLVACPSAVFAAFVRGRRSSSIYHRRDQPATLAELSLADVRRLLRLDSTAPTPQIADRLSFIWWALVAAVVLLAPAALIAAGLWAVLGR